MEGACSSLWPSASLAGVAARIAFPKELKEELHEEMEEMREHGHHAEKQDAPAGEPEAPAEGTQDAPETPAEIKEEKDG